MVFPDVAWGLRKQFDAKTETKNSRCRVYLCKFQAFYVQFPVVPMRSFKNRGARENFETIRSSPNFPLFLTIPILAKPNLSQQFLYTEIRMHFERLAFVWSKFHFVEALEPKSSRNPLATGPFLRCFFTTIGPTKRNLLEYCNKPDGDNQLNS